MKPTTPPQGYSTVSPYLVVGGAGETLRFLEDVFGAERLRSFAAEDGGLVHAEVRIGDSVIMIADGNEAWPPVAAHVHVYVEDVNETYRRALEAGAEGVQEPVRKDDEDRRGGIRDAGGTTWWIATREA
jgi:PhnB protein